MQNERQVTFSPERQVEGQLTIIRCVRSMIKDHVAKNSPMLEHLLV